MSALVATLDERGRVSSASAAFARAAGGDVIGRDLAQLVTPESRHLVLAALGAPTKEGEETRVLLQLDSLGAEPRSLWAVLCRGPVGHALVAEPPADDHDALETTLYRLNGELAALARENARQAKALEKALHELRDAHWHLAKISEVLPMCMSCRDVQTGPDTWESVASYLAKNSNFLSHGYCVRCAERVLSELK